jgi:hypothetical protein
MGFLKREDAMKDEQLLQLQQQLKDMRRETRLAGEAMEQKFARQTETMEITLKQKDEEIEALQGELKQVKHFRQNRAQMQNKLEELENTIDEMELQHKEAAMHMEERYLEEKARLQQEASRKVEDLAEQAHEEAVKNLDETTKTVYKENIRLNEALSHHIEQNEYLKKKTETLERENESLKGDRELNQLLVQEKVSESKRHRKQIKDV